MKNKKIFKIVLTGGPCAGKTKIFKAMIDYLRKNNYYVIAIGETATELIKSDIMPGENKDKVMLFQDLVLKKQYIKERIAENYAKNSDIMQPMVILYDRGIMDGKAYLETNDDFQMILKNNNLNEFELLNNYDLVIDLISTASLMPEEYKLDEIRSETLQKAKNLDYKTTMAWLGHPNMKIIRPKDDIKNKIDEVLKIVTNYLNGYNYPKKQIHTLKGSSDLLVYNDSNSKMLTVSNIYLKGDLIIQKRSYKNTDVYMLMDSNLEYFSLIDKHDALNLLYNHSILSNEIQKEIFFIEEARLYKIILVGDKIHLECDSNNEIVTSENLILDGPEFIKKRKYGNIYKRK